MAFFERVHDGVVHPFDPFGGSQYVGAMPLWLFLKGFTTVSLTLSNCFYVATSSTGCAWCEEPEKNNLSFVFAERKKGAKG